jgi:hypothetical protein
MSGCRAPEIVPWWPAGYGPDRPYLLDGEVYQHHRCATCDRWAYECPECHQVRCDSHLFKSMVGSIPLTCDVCTPQGIGQTYGVPVGGSFFGGELRWWKRSETEVPQ